MKITLFAIAGIVFGISQYLGLTETLFHNMPESGVYTAIVFTALFALILVDGIFHQFKAKKIEIELQERLTDSKQKTQAFQTEVEELKKQIEEWKTTINQLQSENSNYVFELKNDNSIIKQLSNSKNDLTIALSDMQTKFDNLKNEKELNKNKNSHSEAVTLLSLLQRHGRFIDFIKDDITAYQDSQIGGAARLVHQGCAKVLNDFFEISPVENTPEGQKVTIKDAEEIEHFKLIGNIKDEFPFAGVLLHKGWKTSSVKLPEYVSKKPGQDNLITPAEIEVH